MGGNAVKNILGKELHRLTSEEARDFFQNLVDKFSKLEGNDVGKNLNLIPWYHDKNDHGDIDILLNTDNVEMYDIIHFMSETFCAEHVVNKDVVSFGVPYSNKKFIQVDFISSNSSLIDYRYSYFSWNDIGNLIGRIAKSVGLKHGQNGLTYVLRDPQNDSIVIDEVLLTTDHDKALMVLGLDKDVFNNGFNSLDDIFEYVCSSKYFNPKSYFYENRNARDTRRDKKRKTYKLFLEHIRIHSPPDPNETTNAMTIISENFPEAHAHIKELLRVQCYLNAFKNNFNGKIVKNITGLSDKKLGDFMKFCKTNVDLHAILMTASEESVNMFIKAMHLIYEDKNANIG